MTNKKRKDKITKEIIKETNKIIHDLKTGVVTAHMEQLEVYAAVFCLEYVKDPSKIDMELRIYQNNNIAILNPDPTKINLIMDKIITFDKVINKIKEQEN